MMYSYSEERTSYDDHLEEHEFVKSKRRFWIKSLEQLQAEIYQAESTDRSRLHSLKRREQEIRKQLRLFDVMESFIMFEEPDD